MIDNLQLEAFGVFQLLKEQLEAYQYSLPESIEEQVVFDALSKHKEHLATIIVQQEQLDPFKIACWIGEALTTLLKTSGAETPEIKMVLDGVVNTLEALLYIETGEAVFVSDADRMLLHRMLSEKITGNNDHGIGFNGLYVAFHFSCATVKDLCKRGLIKEPKAFPGEKAGGGKASGKIYPEDSGVKK